jgi:hypothetical protein
MKVLEDRVLRRIFGVQESQETGEKCIMGSFTFFYSAPYRCVIWVKKLSRMGLVRHVACMN